MTEVLTLMYVYFDNDGNITKIANYQSSESSFITVSYNEVSKILDGSEQVQDYRVIGNLEKGFSLSRINLKTSLSYCVNDRIYRIPKNKQPAFLYVIQDIKNKKWIFKINPEVQAKILENQIEIKLGSFFSITDFEDPNILYRVLEINLEDLFVSPLEINFICNEESLTTIGLYTHKKINSYVHEVINE